MSIHPKCLPLAIAVACTIAAVAAPRIAPAQTAAPSTTTADRQPIAEPVELSGGQIAAWIAELDSNRYQVRENATRQLLQARGAGLDQVLEAANGDRLEPADRAVWILQSLARSSDHQVALDALTRLMKLRRRPDLAEEAAQVRTGLLLQRCQRKLARLGGQLTVVHENAPQYGAIQLIHLRLGDQWKGSADDLRELITLEEQRFFRLEGTAIDDAAVKLFEDDDDLTLLQLLYTAVTPAAVDSLKDRRPTAEVYVRNKALMGIGAESRQEGVLVNLVQARSGAARAGIVQGDIITAIDGQKVPDFDRLTARIAQHEPGDRVQVDLLRGDRRMRTQVTLGSWTEGR